MAIHGMRVVEEVVGEIKARTGCRALGLVTSGEYPACKKALLTDNGEKVMAMAVG